MYNHLFEIFLHLGDLRFKSRNLRVVLFALPLSNTVERLLPLLCGLEFFGQILWKKIDRK